MNRWLLSVCIVVVLLLAAFYLFVPSEIVVSRVVPVKGNVEAAARLLADTSHWDVWWPNAGAPDRSSEGHPVWAYGKGRYAVSQRFLRSAAVEIDDDGWQIPSMLALFPHSGIDSCLMEWSFKQHSGWNPIRRLKDYMAARKLYDDMGAILGGLRNYLETDSLLYGFNIKQSRIRDTLVAETSRKEAKYPSIADIYSVVEQLQHFVNGYGGRVTGNPMMNVTEDSGVYLLRVALPVDREAIFRDGVVFHQLPATALYLEAEIHGGEWASRNGMRQMDYYISDHQKMLMAIPFLSLVTDRRTEPDTSKWVTRLYVPFF
jgi:hypothetical protein